MKIEINEYRFGNLIPTDKETALFFVYRRRNIWADRTWRKCLSEDPLIVYEVSRIGDHMDRWLWVFLENHYLIIELEGKEKPYDVFFKIKKLLKFPSEELIQELEKKTGQPIREILKKLQIDENKKSSKEVSENIIEVNMKL